MMRFTMVNPMPVPFAAPGWSRKKGVKTRSRYSTGIPGPLSATRNSTRSSLRSASTDTCGFGHPSENLIAFEIRLSKTWYRYSRWQATGGKLDPTQRSIPRSFSSPARRFSTSRRTCPGSIASTAACPAPTLATSNIFSTRSISVFPFSFSNLKRRVPRSSNRVPFPGCLHVMR